MTMIFKRGLAAQVTYSFVSRLLFHDGNGIGDGVGDGTTDECNSLSRRMIEEDVFTRKTRPKILFRQRYCGKASYR